MQPLTFYCMTPQISATCIKDGLSLYIYIYTLYQEGKGKEVQCNSAPKEDEGLMLAEISNKN